MPFKCLLMIYFNIVIKHFIHWMIIATIKLDSLVSLSNVLRVLRKEISEASNKEALDLANRRDSP